MGANRGYSLIEVMLVVAVLGIVAALGIPKITDMIERRSSQNTQLLFVQTLEAARDTARESRRCVRVLYATANSVTVDTRAIDIAGACTATSESVVTKTFNADHIVLPNTLDITFDKVGGVNGATTDFTDVSVTSMGGGVNVTRNYRIFSVLGLVRAL